MSPSNIAPAPDWFDRFWSENSGKMPMWLRTESAKAIARELFETAMKIVAKQAQTPEGLKKIIAFARIQAIMKGVDGVLTAPDPSPDEIAAAVERLVRRQNCDA
jgi:hypothetical protein